MATESYEGSLSMEGTSGCHEPWLFTESWSRQPWRLPHAGERYGSQEPKLTKVARRRFRSLAEEGVATEVSEARSERAPWEDNAHARGISGSQEQVSPRGQARRVQAVIRRSVLGCREALGPPVKSRGAQDSVGCPRGESRGANRERTRYGCTQYHSGGRSRSDASRVLSSGRSQDLLESQGASRKEARSTA
jgi:hypothetical protein